MRPRPQTFRPTGGSETFRPTETNETFRPERPRPTSGSSNTSGGSGSRPRPTSNAGNPGSSSLGGQTPAVNPLTPRNRGDAGDFSRPLNGGGSQFAESNWNGDGRRDGDRHWDGDRRRHGDRHWDGHHDHDDDFHFSISFGWYPTWYHHGYHGGWYDPWHHHHDRWHRHHHFAYWGDCWDPWYPSVYYYSPHWSRWDCDPWPHHSTVFIGTGFTFGSCDSVRFAYSSCSVIPTAVCDPVYTSPVIYADTFTVPSQVIATTTVEQPVYVESLPAPATAAELRAVTDRELADTYVRLGDWASAIRIYAAHVARHPGDVEALRSLGLVQVVDGQIQAGVGSIERAYRIDPTLAQRPVDRALFGKRTLEEVLDSATRFAAERNSAPAWLTVSIIQQAHGQNEPARAAIDRAKVAGLDELVHEWIISETPVTELPPAPAPTPEPAPQPQPQFTPAPSLPAPQLPPAPQP